MRMRCRNNPLLTRLAFVLAVCLFALPGRVVSGELGGLGGLLGEGIDFKGGSVFTAPVSTITSTTVPQFKQVSALQRGVEQGFGPVGAGWVVHLG